MPTTISREEYSALPYEEKKKWVAYTPTSDPELIKEIDIVEAEAKAAQIIQPLHDKLAALPIENLPAEKLQEIIDKIDPMMAAYKAIKKLLGLPIIGQLVAPLVDFINNIVQIIGGLFYLIFVIARGQELFLDGIHNVITQIKWDELEDAMNELKRKEEEAKKQKDANEKNKKIAKENAEKIKKVVDEKTKKEMDEFQKRVEKSLENIKKLEAMAQIQKKIDQTVYFNMTWMGMKSALVSALDLLGIDLSPLDQVTPEQAKKFNDNFPKPNDEIKKMNSLINKMNKNMVYIPLEELEKIDKEAAEAKKKSIADREAVLEKSYEEYYARQEVANKRMEEIKNAEEERIKSRQELIEWRRQRDAEIKAKEEERKKSNIVK